MTRSKIWLTIFRDVASRGIGEAIEFSPLAISRVKWACSVADIGVTEFVERFPDAFDCVHDWVPLGFSSIPDREQCVKCGGIRNHA